MTDEYIYSIWLQESLRYGSRKFKYVKEVYKKASDFYLGGELEWRLSGNFTEREIANLRNTTLGESEVIAQKAHNLKYKILTLFDESYPYLLSQIVNPPGVLYIQGDTSCLNASLPIAIVGTRQATLFGKEMAFEISRDIALANGVIVSGGAKGIDSQAHKGALSAGGKTVAVLGCGINYPYLINQKELREQIAQNGSVISEYPPGTVPRPSNFPIRNRIISGLSLGSVIIEAGEKSGSLITANLANDQNRDVFVVPMHERSSNAKGISLLINDGAQVITCAENVLDEYRGKLGIDFKIKHCDNPKTLLSEKVCEFDDEDLKVESKKNEDFLDDLSDKAKIVYKLLKTGKKIHIDDISRSTKIPVNFLLSALTELELSEIIVAYSGKIYGINYNI